MKKTHVELHMSLPKNVWKLGETIPVHVECSVKGGSTDIDKVCIFTKLPNSICLTPNTYVSIVKKLLLFINKLH